MKKLTCFLALLLMSLSVLAQSSRIPILVYHNLDPVKKGSMTLSTKVFEAQMQWLLQNHYHIIPLQIAVNYLLGKTNSLPSKSVVVTDDDGKKSVYDYMMPIVEKLHIPVTLFIYPSVISKQPYALTWEQLKTLQKTGLFTIESHTWDHPNFKQMQKRMSPEKYAAFLQKQFVLSKNTLQEKMGEKVNLLAWPFGIYNITAENAAEKAGYAMSFTIGYQYATRAHRPMAMPRFMMIASQSMQTFEGLMKGSR